MTLKMLFIGVNFFMAADDTLIFSRTRGSLNIKIPCLHSVVLAYQARYTEVEEGVSRMAAPWLGGSTTSATAESARGKVFTVIQRGRAGCRAAQGIFFTDRNGGWLAPNFFLRNTNQSST
jgi:hypothetical protein